MFTGSLFLASTILGASPTDDPATPLAGSREAQDSLSVQEILTQFQKQKSSSDWFWAHSKVRMECLVKLMKIGPTAVPVLIECLKNEKTTARAFPARPVNKRC